MSAPLPGLGKREQGQLFGVRLFDGHSQAQSLEGRSKEWTRSVLRRCDLLSTAVNRTVSLLSGSYCRFYAASRTGPSLSRSLSRDSTGQRNGGRPCLSGKYQNLDKGSRLQRRWGQLARDKIRAALANYAHGMRTYLHLSSSGFRDQAAWEISCLLWLVM